MNTEGMLETHAAIIQPLRRVEHDFTTAKMKKAQEPKRNKRNKTIPTTSPILKAIVFSCIKFLMLTGVWADVP
jgi:hypothetical protein